MDDRRRALQETLDLLKAEGWNSEDAPEEFPTEEPARKFVLRANPILAIICFLAVVTNFILIGENHSLRQGLMTSVAVTKVLIDGGVSSKTSPEIASLIYRDLSIFINLDNKRIWEGVAKFGKFGYQTYPRSRPQRTTISSRGTLQIWMEVDGLRNLLGESPVSPDDPEESIVKIKIPGEQVMMLDPVITVELSIDKRHGQPATSSKP